jgi:anti-anti-sigma regulatory factor
LKFDLQRKGNDAVIVVGGQLTFSHAGRLHKELLEVFAVGGRVDLFLHDIQETDLTFLQLLCAAQRTAALHGTVFTVGGLDSEITIRRLIHEAGAEQAVGCPDGCLWASAFSAEINASTPVRERRREA